MRIGKLLVLSSAAIYFCHAQIEPSGDPRFEIASVRPAAGRELNGTYAYPGGRIACRGCVLKYLIMEAFGVEYFQISGGPSWMDDDRYDVEAKPPESSRVGQLMPASPREPLNPEQRQMLQSLLTERFHLKYHREDAERPVYLLVKGNKPLKLIPAKDSNAIPWAGGLSGGRVARDGLAGRNVTIDDLAHRLSAYMGGPVQDHAGISGSFDFRCEYSALGDPPTEPRSVISACLRILA